MFTALVGCSGINIMTNWEPLYCVTIVRNGTTPSFVVFLVLVFMTVAFCVRSVGNCLLCTVYFIFFSTWFITLEMKNGHPIR